MLKFFYERSDKLLEIKDEQFGIQLNELKDLVAEKIKHSKELYGELLNFFYVPFLNTFSVALKKLDEDSNKILDCTLRPAKSSTYKAEKKYPLYEVEREIKITIPLINGGPGIAYNVTSTIICNSELVVVDDELNLGDMRPGEFPFTLNVLIIEPVNEISFDVAIHWNIMGQVEEKALTFQCNIQSQDPNVNWGSLEYKEPYSTEIAEGDEFVGRKKKVAVLAKRLLKPRMQSSYITGQKRVGKTSLLHILAHREHPFWRNVNAYSVPS